MFFLLVKVSVFFNFMSHVFYLNLGTWQIILSEFVALTLSVFLNLDLTKEKTQKVCESIHVGIMFAWDLFLCNFPLWFHGQFWMWYHAFTY